MGGYTEQKRLYESKLLASGECVRCRQAKSTRSRWCERCRLLIVERSRRRMARGRAVPDDVPDHVLEPVEPDDPLCLDLAGEPLMNYWLARAGKTIWDLA